MGLNIQEKKALAHDIDMCEENCVISSISM
jgi:hypothetical protein